MPEPVLPAMSACWLVPSPSVMYCSRLAPLRPSGTRKFLAVESVQRSSVRGVTAEKGTSTRFESLAARPTARVSLRRNASSGGASGMNGSSARRPSSSVQPSARPGLAGRHVAVMAPRRRSDSSRPAGSAVRRSRRSSTCTPQRAPLCRMLAKRLAAWSETFTGKSAMTRKRYGSAISPACSLYASMEGYSLRRYFWITVSMCSVRSARRCSMCLGSVQIRSVTRSSISSARCMNPAKLCPSPTGSTNVKRAFPAGIDTRILLTAFCRIRRPSARRSVGASMTSDIRVGAPRKAGILQTVSASAFGQASAGAVGTASGTEPRRRSTAPSRITGRLCTGGFHWSQQAASQASECARSASCRLPMPLAMSACACFHRLCAAAMSARSCRSVSFITSANRASSSASACARRALACSTRLSRTESACSIASARCFSTLPW